MQIEVRKISPEMETFSRAMEAEFAELDRQVAVQVLLSKYSQPDCQGCVVNVKIVK